VIANNEQKTTSTHLNLGRTIYVDDDATGVMDGSKEHPFRYIQDGIDVSQSGDTVFVLGGLYLECLFIDKSITLMGENKETTAIVSDVMPGGSIKVIADHVNITGFKIQGRELLICIESDFCSIFNNLFIVKKSIYRMICIFLEGADNTEIIGNTVVSYDLYSQVGPAIILNNSCYTMIKDNIISNYFYSVSLINSSINSIVHNTLNTRFGVGLYNSFNNKIIWNTFPGTDVLYFVNSSNNTISNNNFGKHGLKEQKYFGNQVKFYDSDNLFDNNYWGRPRLLPKLLFGFKTVDGKQHNTIEVDWHPAKEPVKIL
jgi:nitrous oxidase accessory protein NosD